MAGPRLRLAGCCTRGTPSHAQRADLDQPTEETMTRDLKVRKRHAAPTPHFRFVSDRTAAGDRAVAEMEAVCEADYESARAIFGGNDVPGLPFIVTVDPRAGGAFHQTCADTGIHVSPDDAATLLVAETTECFMALVGNWDCGATPGEGLSRALAQVIRPATVLGELDGDVQGWWNRGQPADWVTQNSPDGDQDNVANACSTLFLFWLHSRLGYSWAAIVHAGGRTLGDACRTLSGRAGEQGFADFVAACRAFAVGAQLQVPANGDPWVGAARPPAQTAGASP
jgi:hypothetical protein